MAVLLLSVDPEYYPGSKQYEGQAEKIYKRLELDWPNVFVAGGWSDVCRTFNATGYGKILVDAKGVVRGVNVHGRELEKLVRDVVSDKPAR